ncbi:penicillin acylase family protein [Spirosoma utsteinense]|uniref:Penicillin amidase n=1 Tax=Spirosoma utsteinense TaxID=2585773 RepID=A0ABR6W4Q4_9BACT|nr:penicillin acylase family protein [Spirosoma utsteinense]MBC3785451.1 penicillin amidase [Spirosoma utsteinense]MBC3791520.1 penicillin amidase [Spirosoma utsteinense]
MRYTKAALISLLTFGIVYGLNRSWGAIPAFGPLLSPFVGFWQNAESVDATDEEITLTGTTAPVTVIIDDLAIPHVFAQNDRDAYFAQGYLTARDRLWQMEFQTHAAAGRVSEIVGDRALELDRYNRRLGMGFGAERSLKAMLADPRSRESVEAYTAGVNAYIKQLKPAQYPLEYKLLGYAPELWKPIKCAYFLKYMSGVLALGADDLNMSNVLKQVGPTVAADLFPDYPFREDPIIPTGTKWDFKPVPRPPTPVNSFSSTDAISMKWPEHDPTIGSNNWAVGAQRSATGYPILANDPHLSLSLPSIWYQMQLVTPTMNVYGATMPGSPGVIIGFNKQVAWGVTNVGADVLDFYKIRFKDNNRREYWHDNQWKPVTRRIETVKVKGQPAVVDTVLYTHHGPVMYMAGQKPFAKNVPVGYAARWIAHEESNDFLTYYLLDRAKNHADYRKALSYYGAPAQNFVFADVAKDIAISPNGRFPLKWKDQGKFLLDGTDPTHDWQGWIPAEHNPHVINPARGFVSSANQSSTDPTYPYYINWQFAPSERGTRINERLAAMQAATPDSLRLLQNDNLNIRARNALPVFLPYLQTQKLTEEQVKALSIVKTWRYNHDVAEIAPTIFTEWMRQYMDAVWKDDFPSDDSSPLRYPSFDRTLQLAEKEPAARWFDNTKTPGRETIREALTQSFQSAVDSLSRQHGKLSEAWQWGNHKATRISHLARLDALSALNVQIGGGNGIVNATSERNGPSWRMVVALGPKPKAYGVYPGGQSGNPGSPNYLNMLETWRTGQLNELLYLQSAQEKNPRIRRKVIIK